MGLTRVVEADLAPLKLLLDTVPPLLRQRAADAIAARDQQAAATYLQALRLELESLVIQLNAAVDGLLLILVTRWKGSAITPSYTKQYRYTWLTDLENEFGFKRADLKGWQEVEETGTDSNLIKHRLGLNLAAGRETPLAINRVVELTEATVLSRFLGVRSWLLELIDRCKRLDEPNVPPNKQSVR